jgi:hypothetical protein
MARPAVILLTAGIFFAPVLGLAFDRRGCDFGVKATVFSA